MVVVAINHCYLAHRYASCFCRIVCCRVIHLYDFLMKNKKKFNSFEIPLSIVILLLILFFLFDNLWFARIGLAIGLFSLLSKTFRRSISILWTKALSIVGFVNAHVLLSLIFFIILLPISIFYRLFNKDKLKLKAGKASYFENRDHLFVAEDLENPW